MAALLALATGCGGTGGDEPTSHPTKDTSITAEAGERFTLTVDGENSSTRSHWYLATPKPDSAVVRSRGREYKAAPGTEKTVGAGGSLTFTFEAIGKGSTEIVLMHCTFNTCNDSTASPGPQTTAPSTAEPETITYTVTVG
ncbi:protease inhibitor I42 family protein [Streptomyces sp. NPDC005485]|uniref:protease inhibitor I42 family protein n=1 Tax=Streptomyces sp. NPDC005485 TaxID=3155591 RepID=UPI0033A19876